MGNVQGCPAAGGQDPDPRSADTTTNYIEHPELVAQRITRFAEVVGCQRVIAGSDCGFATFAARPLIDPRIVWAKLATLDDGSDMTHSAHG